MTRKLRVMVVGAGLAGLATAWALRRRGVEVELVERRRAWGGEGSGLYLPANAVRALGTLGLSAALEQATPVRRQRLCDHRGHRLADIDVGTIWPGLGDCVAIHRAELHDGLREATRDIPLRMGTRVTSIQDGDRPLVGCSDGTSREYDLVVGADGIHSAVRELVFGGPPASPVGQVCWRFVADGCPDVADWTAWLGRGRSFLAVAIGGGRVYCYADLATHLVADEVSPDRDWRAAFADFAEPVAQLLDQGATAHQAVVETVAPPTWAAHRVLLVGDAAHASPPNMAQGAAMSFEDAVVLADLLTPVRPLGEVVAEYEVRRGPRAEWVQRQARQRDRTRTMAPALRNAVLRLGATRLFVASSRTLRSAA